ncbi:MAG: hypothetical protein K2Q27_16130 [Novosphingobium sp.]|jgi:hypothetical protein|uniref:hypothetical protein n=1 Tax=Novosphingobium sp. NDB2Meth1 TaxID=1892847 RepID=UPI000A7BB81D|nr:hypothetical protein [Novosphingobium sp. NDB2Meth1]MBY0394780.1 hypothetical protein [Novosphingobium sp.]
MATENPLGHLVALESHEIVGSFVAVLVAAFAFFRWLLGLAGARQDKRIRDLEARVTQADNRAMAIAQVVMALIPIVEGSHPDHPALHDAKTVLKRAFPADPPEHPDN